MMDSRRPSRDSRSSSSVELSSALLIFVSLCSVLECCCSPAVARTNAITLTEPVNRGETLISVGKVFELGFFSPNGAQNGMYLGIWQYGYPNEVVWVANRDKAVPASATNVRVRVADGNLRVEDDNGSVFWSTNIVSSSSKPLVANLMESGNLVLMRNETEKILWESFKHPTDTFLPGMKMDGNIRLISWRSPHDPSPGNYTFQLDRNYYAIFKHSTLKYWTSEDSDGDRRRGVPPEVLDLLSNFSRINTVNFKFRNLSISFQNLRSNKSISRMVMKYDGQVESYRERTLIWNFCGDFAFCKNSSGCKSLPNFLPRSLEQWTSGDFFKGSTRKLESCDSNATFSRLKYVRIRKDGVVPIPMNLTECQNECLSNCGCQAFAYKQIFHRLNDHECLILTEGLRSVEEHGDYDLFVRIVSDTGRTNHGKSPKHPILKSRLTLLIVLSVVSFVGGLCVFGAYYYNRKFRLRQENRANQGATHFCQTESFVSNLINSNQFQEEDKKCIEVPFFSLESIVAATDNFSDSNRLGRGGFGTVYKGTFAEGQEIAVKRLSRASGQGLQEFKNEVVLIGKLQHRNLVRLLGYCIEGDEKILLYEYMSNKSLDSFLFDGTLCKSLNWHKRFDIISGIARGLLYLHQDSRLKIIHRDLKTSNILLDEEMNPKISDFGLAKIFGSKQVEAITERVVGTIGYIAPEYASYGFFSEKSDVFSFGIVVLEIIIGRRNNGFFQSDHTQGLIGYIWKYWNEGKVLELMDQEYNNEEFMRCVNVGLLCVQEDPSERPTMEYAVRMLSNGITVVPKRPAFLARRDPSSSVASLSKPEPLFTGHDLSLSSIEEGR